MNPFEFESANALTIEDLVNYYIQDFNFSRFLQSKKNLFLIGERGSGKTMTIRYNSFPVQHYIATKNNIPVDYSLIGIHVICKNPIFHKEEYVLIEDEIKKSVICEHFLVLTIIQSVVDSLSTIPEIVTSSNKCKDLISDIEYIWDVKLPEEEDFFSSIRKFITKQTNLAQRKINSFNADVFFEETYSFSSHVLTFLKLLQRIDLLSNSHFMLMFDDAHEMNVYQIRALNSWIAYRDHSLYSLKVATAKVFRPIRKTIGGGTILEGHDYITVDMEQPFQSAGTAFYNLSKMIIERRLSLIGINDKTVDDFFPTNKKFTEDIIRCKEQAKNDAIAKFGIQAEERQIKDYVNKYYRAIYFKSRSSKANRPTYTGFDTIVDISTGVIRNLLDPCFWMYDAVLNQNKSVTYIPDAIQTDIIISRSEDLWNQLREGVDKSVENCSSKQGQQLFHLFDNLGVLFAKRLKADISEPRAIVFTITQYDEDDIKYQEFRELLLLAMKARILYTRIGNAKEAGRQETYYVPNRLLFPALGLDPHGQYSRVSIKFKYLYDAAVFNTPIPSQLVGDKITDEPLLFEDYE